jgi:mannose-1-phosphate guanylyltransferase/phosphomannomutase
VVIDFSNSPAGQILPPSRNDLGCEVIGLNAYIDEERGPKAEDKPQSSRSSPRRRDLEAQALLLDPP